MTPRERAKAVAADIVGWMSPKLTRPEIELEITKILERELSGTDIPTDADYDRAQWQHWKKRFEQMREELVATKRERDLAIAHDRQPYPTAEAYRLACAARDRHSDRADAAERQLGKLSTVTFDAIETLRQDGSYSEAAELLRSRAVAALSAPASPATTTVMVQHDPTCGVNATGHRCTCEPTARVNLDTHKEKP